MSEIDNCSPCACCTLVEQYVTIVNWKLDKLMMESDRCFRELFERQGNIMALIDDLRAHISALDAATTEVAKTIEALLAKLGNPSITETEKQEVLDALAASTARLKALAADPNTPVPPPEPDFVMAKSVAKK